MTHAFIGLRLLLGAILAVTAANYFLPSLVPFLETRAWNDPMAARLVAAFDQSGLLAAAKFLHFAAGLALLLNRSVPLALAAAMPVNVCGTYVALMLEGDPLLAAAALGVLALNGALMLAYLPYYRAVYAPGALADGEGEEPGENYNSVFVNPLAGAPLLPLLGGAAMLAAAFWFYWDVVLFANGTTGRYTLAFPIAILAVNLVRALLSKWPRGG